MSRAVNSSWSVEVLRREDLDVLPFSTDLQPHLARLGTADALRRDLVRYTACGFTIRSGVGVMAAAGVMDLWPLCGEVWLFLHPELSASRFVVVHRILRDLVDTMMGGYRRLQAHVPAAAARSARWMGLMGFHVEGTLKKFGPEGEDFLVLGRT